MQKLELLLSELVDEVELASDVDACIEKYAKRIRSCVQQETAKSYQLLACQDSGHHLVREDERGRCVLCGESG